MGFEAAFLNPVNSASSCWMCSRRLPPSMESSDRLCLPDFRPQLTVLDGEIVCVDKKGNSLQNTSPKVSGKATLNCT
jgi:hypothetical protein